jgi:tRNA:m4X modification enzyme
MEAEKEQQEKNPPGICQFFIKRKKRQCKFEAIKGSKYCAPHCSDLEGQVECPHEKGFFVSAG